MLTSVAVAHKSLADYTHIVGRPLIEEIRELAEPLRGKRVVHLNATAYGGGVAEILGAAPRDLLEPPPRVTVIARGQVITEDDAFMQDGRVFVAADEVTRVLGWTVAKTRSRALGDTVSVAVSASGASLKGIFPVRHS